MDILDRVPAMTNQRVNVGSGTLYTLLEQFLEVEMMMSLIMGNARIYRYSLFVGKIFSLLADRICSSERKGGLQDGYKKSGCIFKAAEKGK